MIGSSSESNTHLPYNAKNVVISKQELEAILKVGDVAIGDIDIYRGAFVHRSYCTRKNENVHNGNLNRPPNCLPLQDESNERLEFLGDAVLSLVVAGYLFERFPDENEGFLTKMRTKLVNGVMLAHLSDLIGLGKYVILSQQIEEGEGRTNKNILEDCFEALIGAIYMDAGFDAAKRWIIRFIETELDFAELITGHDNFKDMMIKHFQRAYGWIPRLVDLKRSGNLHQVCAKDASDNVISKGKGDSKKAAEMDCARNLLVTHGVLS